ncbi:excinuclease ABC subunit B [Puniceibacterium confluentis]|uniref:excinuclease ABC subunit B n=1 Tax=Puniceibacterium confluentis TaxID=1958944 RepID=UPI001FECC988|nr:excinuclease ABC subunit B [Puniceibacterium confluentis]
MDAAPGGVYRDVMRPIALISLLALAACATPRQQCEADAAAPYRAALQERARLSSDLARGFTYNTRFERRERFGLCRGRYGAAYHCWQTDTQPVTRRVPVDSAALQARLSALDSALPGLRHAAAQDTSQCRALYPAAPEN